MQASQPARAVKQLHKVVNAYKPVSDHKNNVGYVCVALGVWLIEKTLELCSSST